MRVALDTNVVSELTKPDCDEQVLAWARTLLPQEVYLPAPCWAELRRATGLLPPGRRRQRLESSLEKLLGTFADVLPFGLAEAEVYGELMSEPGRPRPTIDAMIAAICRVADLPLATRNVRDFDGCGLQVINPWAQP